MGFRQVGIFSLPVATRNVETVNSAASVLDAFKSLWARLRSSRTPRSTTARVSVAARAKFPAMGRMNNRAEYSHLPFRRRERAMIRFRRMKTLQKFAAVHGTVHNHFSQERHLISRDLYRERRSAALAEWRAVMG
jgi:transposase-like protein